MSDMDRRTLLKGAAGAAGLAALAGCTEEDGEGDTTQTASGGGGSSQSLTPPEPPDADPENEYWQFVVDSLEYQNEMLNRMD